MAAPAAQGISEGAQMKHGKGSKKTSAGKSTNKSGRKAEKQSSFKKDSRSEKAAAPKRSSATGAAESRRPNGRSGGGGKSGAVSFSNPAVANAFRRAVKKYGTALKRLTD